MAMLHPLPHRIITILTIRKLRGGGSILGLFFIYCVKVIVFIVNHIPMEETYSYHIQL
jgi:hypothetical protein